MLKKSILIITKSNLTGLTKLSWQSKKVKLQKAQGDGQRTSLSYLQKSLADPKKNFAVSLEKLALKNSRNNEVLEKIPSRWKWKPIFKQNNADQVKGNATKLEQTSYGKNISGPPSFIQTFLI